VERIEDRIEQIGEEGLARGTRYKNCPSLLAAQNDFSVKLTLLADVY